MRKTFLLVFLLTGIFGVKAQEETFTEEELTKYATVMVWAEEEKANLGSIVSDSVSIWIEETPLETGKYIELSKADKNGELATAEATEEELAVYNEVQEKIEGKKTKFVEVYKTKIKEDIGAGLYNKLRKALKSDAELKARYDEVYASIEASSEEPSGDADSEE